MVEDHRKSTENLVVEKLYFDSIFKTPVGQDHPHMETFMMSNEYSETGFQCGLGVGLTNKNFD